MKINEKLLRYAKSEKVSGVDSEDSGGAQPTPAHPVVTLLVSRCILFIQMTSDMYRIIHSEW